MIKKIILLATSTCFLFYSEVHAQNESSNRFWADIDYLFWKIQNSPEPVPLVILGPTLAVPPPVLGAPDTFVVLGGTKIDNGWRSGGKIDFGYWFDNNHYSGTEISYCFLPNASKECSVSSNGSANSPLLLVPFYNVITHAEDSTAIASPLLGFQGKGVLKLVNNMQGAELNIFGTMPLHCDNYTFTGLTGFRYWNFNEHLEFTTNSPYIPPHVLDVYKTKDRFSVKNNFFGLQFGLGSEYNCNCISIMTKFKIAVGANFERLAIRGNLLTNDYDDFGIVQEYSGGYFALPTNIGNYNRVRFAAIPELNIDIGYQIFNCMQIKLGYTFMYVSNVLWAGNQIDRNINPTQATTYTNAQPAVLEGQPSPKANLKTGNLWAQGLKVGLEFIF